MKNQIAITKVAPTSGCTFKRLELRFGSIDDEVLSNACEYLAEIAKSSDWWWGDYLVAYAENRLGDVADDEDKKEKQRRHFIRTHSTVLSGDELADVQLKRYDLAKFYPIEARVVGLTKRHHEEAMSASGGDLAVAQSWLDQAVLNEWSANQLRAEIRSKTRREAGAGVTKETITQEELFGARQWAGAQLKRVDEMEPEEAEYLFAQLEPVIALAAALAAKVGLSLPAPRGGKESFTLASQRR